MKRRDFFEKSGTGVAGMLMAYLGLNSGAKKEEAAAAGTPAQAPAQEAPVKKMSRKDMVKKMLIEKMNKTEEEAEAMIADFEKKLPMVKQKCICRTCPTYVKKETNWGFCHPLVGKSEIITEEKGCDCPKCPIYQSMGLKNGYYCTRKSEMEQEMAKKV